MSGVIDMVEIMDTLKKLHESINTMNEVIEATKKVQAGFFKNVDDAILRKRIEDGVIAHLNNATPGQIESLFKQGFFQYYREVHDDVSFIKIK